MTFGILCINIHIISHHSLSYVMSSVCVFDVAFIMPSFWSYTKVAIINSRTDTNVYKSLMWSEKRATPRISQDTKFIRYLLIVTVLPT